MKKSYCFLLQWAKLENYKSFRASAHIFTFNWTKDQNVSFFVCLLGVAIPMGKADVNKKILSPTIAVYFRVCCTSHKIAVHFSERGK
jgi:hypothetical protein